MTTRTGEELKIYYCEKLGKDFGEYFFEIYSQTVWLFVEWEQYKKLFTDEKTVEILNKTAKSYFALQQRIQFNNVVLNVAKLLDNVKVVRYENLTYLRLASYIKDENFRSVIEDDLVLLKGEREAIKNLRDNLLAHNGLECILSEGMKADAFSAVTLGKVDTILNLIESVFQKVYSHYFHAYISFNDTLFKFGAGNLIYMLKNGLRLEKIRRENPDYDPSFWKEN
ncbi:TPA: hypothetical protein DCR49_05185 [Candidatus Delongbacteria bacterium]|nr:hypothetical protein [Candidatus Delongbacteria bacterium]